MALVARGFHADTDPKADRVALGFCARYTEQLDSVKKASAGSQNRRKQLCE